MSKQITVLIVDDDYVHNKVYKLMFETEDVTVKTLLSGENIIDEALTFAPDVVLLDVNLGDKSGFDVVIELKRNPTTTHIPVIFISSDKDPETIRNSFFLGGVEFIEKTPNIKSIVKHVKELAILEGISSGLARVKHLLDCRT